MRFWIWMMSGGAILVIVSLYNVYEHTIERYHQREILAHGREAEARVLKSVDFQSVLIEWVDSDGKRRTGEARTGKTFARLASQGQRVEIKYDVGSLKPVILSEVATGESTNEFLITNLWIAISFGTGCAILGTFMWRERFRRNKQL